MALKDHATTRLPSASLKPAGIASRSDYAVCRQVMRTASKNYSFASNFLPTRKRRHVEALYALLRVGDDFVDITQGGFPSPLAAIDWWERAYWRSFDRGDAAHPVLRAYLDTATRFGIPAETMRPYFRAMREDLTINRFPTFDDLMHYMDGSSIPVGRAMTFILGVRKPNTLEMALKRADKLAIAMQLSNFWRDIGQDWDIGRVYIPAEDMDRFGISEADLGEARLTPNFINLLEFELARTEIYYDEASDGVPMLASGQWGVMSSLLIYRAILSAIRRNGYDVFNRRAAPGITARTGLVFKAWILTRRAGGMG